jgi:hypothetical protein
MNKTLNQDVTGLDKQFAVLDLQHSQDSANSGKPSVARYVPPFLRGGGNSANSNSSHTRDSRSDRDSQPRYSDRGSYNNDRGAYTNNRGNFR